MSPDQARALLELIADLYRVAAEQPVPEPSTNGHVDQGEELTLVTDS